MKKKNVLFWFRNDLRLADNPGLYKAAHEGNVLALYIHDTKAAGKYTHGEASSWWLHHSLGALNKQLHSNLNFYLGNAESIITKLCKKYDISAVYWNDCYEPWRVKQDKHITDILKKNSIAHESFNASLLWQPWDVLKKDKTFYKVFTPFYTKGCINATFPRKLLKKPTNTHFVHDAHHAVPLKKLGLLPTDKRFTTMRRYWNIGEDAAHKKMLSFFKQKIGTYSKNRDFPAEHGTSLLSPHLHFGEISPHQVWHYAHSLKPSKEIAHFLRELGWREFSYYLLYHFPQLPEKNFQKKFDAFPWCYDKKLLHTWQQGKTGYPIIDAGMRELWQTGYMHNRVRMIVGSFLVKNLLLHWHHGEQWFWNCLVDADLANNSASWQWVAGSGVDAAPFFRIFNPTTQAKKFDPEGIYIRTFVPELTKLPNKYIFEPSKTPAHILSQAHVILGKTYPLPIIDLEQSRKTALKIFLSLKQK